MSEETNKLIHIDIGDEMKKCYIDYAMSVIVSRALPDVRDGLKPVHRRILYATMSDLGFYPDKPHRKSARIVGEVLGKYHPHGDSSVYNAMVRMAQDFSIRYMLIDGHGNFGSVDGDSAAAMRYTEARLTRLSMELMRDLEKETVDFSPNFDETLQEPVVMPSRFPNLLVNGSNGIAVGMATSIPPHNLGEVIDGVIKLIDEPEADIEDLMELVKGPDFPTGAEILGKSGLRKAYMTGRGGVIVRSICEIEEISKGKQAIIVNEIPFQVNKSKLLEDIADLVKNKKIEGITDLRDESDRNGIRVVIELRRDANAHVILNKLYKHTQLQSSYSMIMLALVNGIPRVLNLKEILSEYVKHQRDVETRRVKYDLRKAEERAHILEGLLIALNNIEEVIKLIRSSDNAAIAKKLLVDTFSLTEIQAQAILDMRLQRLTGLERDKIESEHSELMKTIGYLRDVLSNDYMLMDIIKTDLLSIRDRFSDDRRTRLSMDENEINYEDLIEEEEVIVTLTNSGYIKRIPATEYSLQKRGGRGKSSIKTKEEDYVVNIFTTSTHDHILFFTDKGRMYRLKGYNIPEGSRAAKGTAIVNLIQLQPEETVTAIIPVKSFENGYLVMCTRNGIVKKSLISNFNTARKNGIFVMNLVDDDELIEVKMTTGSNDIVIVTRGGMSIRFSEDDLRPMGRMASGVIGIRLKDGDKAVSLQVVDDESSLLVISRNGFGKRTSYSDYRTQKRGGYGLRTYSVTEKTGELMDAVSVITSDEIVITSDGGVVIRIKVEGLKLQGRITSGVTLMKCDDNTCVASVAKIYESDDDDGEGDDI